MLYNDLRTAVRHSLKHKGYTLLNVVGLPSLGLNLYGLCIGAILIVTLLAVGFETLKAALNNPAKAFRYE